VTTPNHARRGALFAAASILLLGTAHAAKAQSILDANRVEFTPSSDDGVLNPSGLPLVSKYTMTIFPAGSAIAIQTVDLGKPSPDLDGYIRVDFSRLLTVPLTPGASYEASVAAVGPSGTDPSLRSNTFGYSTLCSYSITPPSQSFNAAAAAGSVAVSTGPTCQWTAVSQASWLTVTSGASGTGSGTVSFSVAANTGTASRTANIVTAGWNFSVLQAAPAPPAPPPPSQCSYTLSATSAKVATEGGTVSLSVSTVSGCPWTSVSPVSWAVISTGASMLGPGTVTVTVAKNNSFSTRSVTLAIAGQSFVLAQDGRQHR
jgi:Viral BACON domain/Putative binding domain, N-terminal